MEKIICNVIPKIPRVDRELRDIVNPNNKIIPTCLRLEQYYGTIATINTMNNTIANIHTMMPGYYYKDEEG